MKYLRLVVIILGICSGQIASTEEYREQAFPAVKTHLGDLAIIDFRDSDGARHEQQISLNGEKIYKARKHWLRYIDSFQLKGKDYIVIGESYGGTGNRYDHLTILYINQNKVVNSFYDAGFYSVKNQYKMDVTGEDAVVDLGLEKRKNKLARFNGREVLISFEEAEYAPLSANDCRALHKLSSQCTMYQEWETPDCKKAIGFFPASNADSWTFRYIKEQTGFNDTKFSEECFAICETNKLAAYEDFSVRICGREMP